MGSTSEDPVLLVIDLQAGLVDPPAEAGPRSTPNLTTNVPKILDHFRQQKWPVIHINHDDFDPEHHLNKDRYPVAFAPHACSAPIEGEPMLHKQTGSAFVDPKLGLADKISSLGGPNADVVIIGMDGAQCVNDNTRSANDLGFKVTVIADACATFGMEDYRDPTRQIGAEETHTAAISILKNGFRGL
ncbi:nicotinamidase [Cladophialophora chaetospira]|uniref:Nicotinamidase n=1 Tax=Cladophialophora chaetospira TaxID=386627 RepID=A0AA39CIV2_9EURO|nr:nicotinamidase [Cladophialophora chaetospira]